MPYNVSNCQVHSLISHQILAAEAKILREEGEQQIECRLRILYRKRAKIRKIYAFLCWDIYKKEEYQHATYSDNKESGESLIEFK